ncbi:ATP-dependent DNA helicase RecG [Alteromonadales bacterium alter-6D02]|nr:ATP-dependent DNA helicase RecG [Alteromonadales bacterium alter-6D02]
MLASPLTDLKGVGAKMAEKLAKLELYTIEDLLFHLPNRYEDRTTLYTLNQIRPGDHVSFIATIEYSEILDGRRKRLICHVSDDFGRASLVFFHFNASQKNALATGKTIRCFGEIKIGARGLEVVHPEYKLISEYSNTALEETLTPVYPATDGVKQLTLRGLANQAIDYLKRYQINDLLPAGLYPEQTSLTEALLFIHQPPPDADIELLTLGQHPMQQRLVIEELIAHNLSMLQAREQSQQLIANKVEPTNPLESQFLAQLPFAPTGAQQRVIAEIKQDLNQPKPMMRLVQGDVGSGKTLVAAMAALGALFQQQQVVLMAPTELLAEQHALTFAQWLEPLGIKVGWLAGKLKGKARTKTLEQIASGEIQMLVGTHAVFQQEVEYNNLVLVIIDEQHRFGVHQRLALREKGMQGQFYPHQLIMTATPIPRTLAMTAYADLDTSIIDELPPGRTPVTTVAVSDQRRNEVIERVRQACLAGRQSYWVCTLIDESEVLQCQAAEQTAQELNTILSDLNIGLVHGRMKAKEKQLVMEQFKQGEIHLLVATTVIEVGVDVPNASLMIIENPERLGLAQLHQLRGRVGRGSIESHCVLLYHSPLSMTASKRLGVLRDTNDGFIIAQKDLEIRGPGEVLGTKQTGLADLKIADLVRDQQLIPLVGHLAPKLVAHYPEWVNPIVKRWLGNRSHYNQA